MPAEPKGGPGSQRNDFSEGMVIATLIEQHQGSGQYANNPRCSGHTRSTAHHSP